MLPHKQLGFFCVSTTFKGDFDMYVNFGVLVLGHLTVLYDTCNCAKDLLEWTIILLDMGCMDLGGVKP